MPLWRMNTDLLPAGMVEYSKLVESGQVELEYVELPIPVPEHDLGEIW